jgi:hypothetical protein
MTHRFKLLLDFREGTTIGDRNALIDRFTGAIVDAAGLAREEIVLTGDAVVITYRFARRLTSDEMHDVCRAIFRYFRKHGGGIQGIGISDRSWWTPTYVPGQLDPPVDPLDPSELP